MDQVSGGIEEAVKWVHQVPSDLSHSGFIGVGGDPSDVDATSVLFDDEEHVVSDKSTHRQYLDRKEIRGGK